MPAAVMVAWILLQFAGAVLLLWGGVSGKRWAMPFTLLLGLSTVGLLAVTMADDPARPGDRALCDAAFTAWTEATDPVRLEREREVIRALRCNLARRVRGWRAPPG